MNDVQHDDHDADIRADFERWCHEFRLLGRDGLWPAYREGWTTGFRAAAEQNCTPDDEEL